jgi:hypothetical protein
LWFHPFQCTIHVCVVYVYIVQHMYVNTLHICMYVYVYVYTMYIVLYIAHCTSYNNVHILHDALSLSAVANKSYCSRCSLNSYFPWQVVIDFSSEIAHQILVANYLRFLTFWLLLKKNLLWSRLSSDIGFA